MEPTKEQIIENMKSFIGKRVQVLEGENLGQKGTTVRPELKDGKPLMLVKLDDGSEVHVNNKQIMFIMATIQIDPKRQN